MAAQARWLPRIWKSLVRFPDRTEAAPIYMYCVRRKAQGVLLCEGWGIMVSQLHLPSLPLFSVAGCGRLQLGAAHWPTLVTLLQIVDNWPHKF